jgi:hypothetical protein
MANGVPAVMVSSTFYDLRQIRADLAEFITDGLGYRALLSEHPSFPVDPDLETIENCRRRVEEDADILVLVVGGRYGYVDTASAKSVTNLEYLTARAKGIPIYAFVDRSVLGLLPLWERNPDADFSHAVSDPRLLDFLQQVRSVDRVWMHEFATAQDIVGTLRPQLAFLMREGLRWRLQVRRREPDDELQGLHGKSLRIALERPPVWEYRLFAQALIGELQTHRELREEHRLGITFGAGEEVPLPQAAGWCNTRLAEISRLADGLDVLVNQALQEAFGPPGQPGDVGAIAFVARKVGAAYRHAIEWSLRVRRARTAECFQPALPELALSTADIIEKLEAYGPAVLQQIEDALVRHRPGEPQTINAVLKLSLSNQDRFSQALRQAERDCWGHG